jgi:hypothetical protein
MIPGKGPSPSGIEMKEVRVSVSSLATIFAARTGEDASDKRVVSRIANDPSSVILT